MIDSPRRILILTADYGFGHRSASLAIEAALQYIYGSQVVTEITNPIDFQSTPAFLRKEQVRYDQRVRQTPRLYKLGYDIGDLSVTTSVIESSMIVMLYESVRKALRTFQPDAIVTTYPLYLSPLASIFTIERKHIPLHTVVTDMATVPQMWFNAVSDLTLVPTEIVRELAIKNRIKPDEVRLTGIPVHPNVVLETRSKEEIRAELGWDPSLASILVVGSKRVRNLTESLNVLNHSGLPIQLCIVAGGDQELYSELERTEWHAPVHLYNRVANIPTMMHAADAIICKAGGLITSEALACDLPILYIDVIQGQETGNAEIVIQNKAGELAINPVDTLVTLYHWLDHDHALLTERAQAAKQLGKPQAAFDIARLAWEAAAQEPNPKVKSLIDFNRLTILLNRFEVPWQEKSG